MNNKNAKPPNLDRDYADRLKNENPQQFETLVKMHMSFELDLHTDEYEQHNDKGKVSKWNRFHKKPKSSSNKSNSPENFKQPLTKDGIVQVRQLIEFLVQEDNIIQEGIFRRTGAVTRQNELKSQLSKNIVPDLKKGTFSVHDCATVLKGFLADLPEPLLTDIYYSVHCQIAEICNSPDVSTTKEARLLNTLQLLFLLLPEENRILLEFIIEMLHKTMLYEKSNKMSADSLSTMFCPHLICPRKLSPEALHQISQNLSGIVSFMISKGVEIFDVPIKLATDIRAYFMEQKRKLTMSPDIILDESVTSDSTANTVFTFVDREKTAEAHHTNPTDTALAQLYAHIQQLPESSKKRKLIKQFNKENGQGTPLQMLMVRNKTNSAVKSGGKSLGDSIKKHIFNKHLMSRTPKRSHTPSSGFDTPIGGGPPKMRVLFQSPAAQKNSPRLLNKPQTPSTLTTKDFVLKSTLSTITTTPTTSNKISNSDFNNLIKIKDDDDVKYLQEIIVPVEKKTVVFMDMETLDDPHFEDSDEDDNDDSGEYYDDQYYGTPPEESNFIDTKSRFKSEPNLSKILETVKFETPKKLATKLIKGVSMVNLRLPFSTEKKLVQKSKSVLIKSSMNRNCFKENIPESREFFHSNFDCLENTPVTFRGRNSMSPISKSTQRMPKSMQESIMTPRSRKPVMLLGALLGSSEQNQNSFSSLQEVEEEFDESFPENEQNISNLYRSKSEGDFIEALGEQPQTTKLNEDNTNFRPSSAPETLTNTFRDYLFTRSVLTTSPEDLSFSSQPDDFGSSTDIRDMDLSESELNDSLLYCLNGNKPIGLSSEDYSQQIDKDMVKIENFPQITRKRQAMDDFENLNRYRDAGNYLGAGGDLQSKKLILKHSELDETSL